MFKLKRKKIPTYHPVAPNVSDRSFPLFAFFVNSSIANLEKDKDITWKRLIFKFLRCHKYFSHYETDTK